MAEDLLAPMPEVQRPVAQPGGGLAPITLRLSWEDLGGAEAYQAQFAISKEVLRELARSGADRAELAITRLIAAELVQPLVNEVLRPLHEQESTERHRIDGMRMMYEAINRGTRE